MFCRLSFFFIFFAIVFFNGCANKEIYKPNNIDSLTFYDGILPSTIESIKRNGASLVDGTIIVKSGLSKFKIKSSFRLVDFDDKNIITSNNDGLILVYDYDGKIIYDFNTTNRPLSAIINNDIMYGVNINNEVFIFDISNNSFIYKESHHIPFAIDAKIAQPEISKDLVVIPTLDGKISIFDLNTNKLIRDIRLDASNNFANASFIKIIDDKLYCATKNKLILVSPKSFQVKDFSIKDIFYLNDFFYIFTVEGDVIKLDRELEEKSSVKLKFARFSSANHIGNKIYILERTGYMMVLDTKLNELISYEIAVDNEKILFLDNMLYFGNKYKKLDI